MEFGFYRWELVDLAGAPVDHVAVSLVHQLDRLLLQQTAAHFTHPAKLAEGHTRRHHNLFILRLSKCPAIQF